MSAPETRIKLAHRPLSLLFHLDAGRTVPLPFEHQSLPHTRGNSTATAEISEADHKSAVSLQNGQDVAGRIGAECYGPFRISGRPSGSQQPRHLPGVPTVPACGGPASL